MDVRGTIDSRVVGLGLGLGLLYYLWGNQRKRQNFQFGIIYGVHPKLAQIPCKEVTLRIHRSVKQQISEAVTITTAALGPLKQYAKSFHSISTVFCHHQTGKVQSICCKEISPLQLMSKSYIHNKNWNVGIARAQKCRKALLTSTTAAGKTIQTFVSSKCIR